MPYLKCRKCHHEWEAITKNEKCDWCNTDRPEVLEDETPLEKMLNENHKELFTMFILK
jgi:Zn finger protein HypA/HybF involved in hydrogenase expression